MDLGTLMGAGLGAVVGTGSTMLADRFSWKRDRISRREDVERVAAQQDLDSRRELYGRYLAALSLTTHQLRGLLRERSLEGGQRTSKADEIMSDSNAYLLRYQIRIVAPCIDKHVEVSFAALRELRRCVTSTGAGNDMGHDASVDAATQDITASIAVLLRAMREDLSEESEIGPL